MEQRGLSTPAPFTYSRPGQISYAHANAHRLLGQRRPLAHLRTRAYTQARPCAVMARSPSRWCGLKHTSTQTGKDKMRVRPFFWILLTVVCIGILAFAATVTVHNAVPMQARIDQVAEVAHASTLVRLHLTDPEGMPIDQASVIPPVSRTSISSHMPMDLPPPTNRFNSW